jgi:hypothetical protein
VFRTMVNCGIGYCDFSAEEISQVYGGIRNAKSRHDRAPNQDYRPK